MDSETRELSRDGRPVHVTPMGFRLLQVLIEKRPKALSKEQLHDLLWPRSFVSDATLTGLVKEVRAAIGDDAKAPRFIRTVAAFGYAFSGDVAEESSGEAGGSRFRIIGLGREAPLAEGENILGRGPESVLWIENDTVSRAHAKIRICRGSATLEDLSSKNGTFLRGRRLETSATLEDGDEIRVGDVPLRFRAHSTPGSTQSAIQADRKKPDAAIGKKTGRPGR
ncbi:MAG: FHA domain-containing protein [Acidobacteriota bacterium]